MTFAYPWVLVLLLVPLALAWWWRGSRSRVQMPYDNAPTPRRRWLRSLLALPHIAGLLALASAITLLAGPQQLMVPRGQRELTNIQIVMDVSGSMSFSEGDSTRYQLACAAIDHFTRIRTTDAMGLIVFGSQSIRLLPITTDLEALRRCLPLADPEKQPDYMGSTAAGAALRFASQVVEAESQTGDRVIILVSDGESPDLEDGGYQEVANILSDANIRCFYFHIGAAANSPEAEQVAVLTGGRAFKSLDRQSLLESFRVLDAMTKAKVHASATQVHEFYRPFAVALLASSFLHLVGLLGLRYTPW
jgi:Ca-activated chloride channel homolog